MSESLQRRITGISVSQAVLVLVLFITISSPVLTRGWIHKRPTLLFHQHQHTYPTHDGSMVQACPRGGGADDDLIPPEGNPADTSGDTDINADTVDEEEVVEAEEEVLFDAEGEEEALEEAEEEVGDVEDGPEVLEAIAKASAETVDQSDTTSLEQDQTILEEEDAAEAAAKDEGEDVIRNLDVEGVAEEESGEGLSVDDSTSSSSVGQDDAIADLEEVMEQAIELEEATTMTAAEDPEDEEEQDEEREEEELVEVMNETADEIDESVVDAAVSNPQEPPSIAVDSTIVDEEDMSSYFTASDGESSANVDREELADDEAETALDDEIVIGTVNNDDRASIDDIPAVTTTTTLELPTDEASFTSATTPTPIEVVGGGITEDEAVAEEVEGDEEPDGEVAIEEKEETEPQVAAPEEGSTPSVPLVIDAKTQQILLNDLNYLRREIRIMKPEIAAVVAEKKLRRPLEGIPTNWVRTDLDKGLWKRIVNRNTLPKLLVPVLFGALVVRGGLDVSEIVAMFWKPSRTSEESSSSNSPVDEDKSTEATEDDTATTADDSEAISIKPGGPRPAKHVEPPDETWLDKIITGMQRLWQMEI